jgi:hypothetical protein
MFKGFATWFVQKDAEHFIAFTSELPNLEWTLASRGLLEIEILYKFLITCRERAVSAADVKISPPTPI